MCCLLPAWDNPGIFNWDTQQFQIEGCPQELGFMDEPMAFRVITVLEFFFIYSFIFADRFPIYVDSVCRRAT